MVAIIPTPLFLEVFIFYHLVYWFWLYIIGIYPHPLHTSSIFCYNIFMSQYFDKSFLKFLLGFVAIVIISLVIVAILRNYQDGKIKPVSPQNYTATTQP